MQKKLGKLDDTVEQLEDSQLLSHLNDRQVAALSHALKNPGARYRIRKHQYDYQVTYQNGTYGFAEAHKFRPFTADESGS